MSLTDDQVKMTVVRKVVTDDLFIFVLENALLDRQDRTVSRDMRPAFAPVAHIQALLRHHDCGSRLGHFD